MSEGSAPGDRSLPLSRELHVHRECRRFEDAWRSGTRPCLDDFVGHTPEPARSVLFRGLLELELTYRRRAGERPAPEEYRGRFAGHDALIDAVFQIVGNDGAASPRPGEVGAGGDDDLLFGLLAVQMGFIDGDAMSAALRARATDWGKPLGEILVMQGALSEARRAQLEGTIRERLEQTSLFLGLTTQASGDEAGSTQNSPGDSDGSTSTGRRFRKSGLLASGGLGAVFLALDEELNREVALKEIREGFADDLPSRARFLLEALVTAGLEHPGIVPVYGLGRYADGRPFYAMRFIRGHSLHDAIQKFYEDEKAIRDPGERTLAFQRLLRRFLAVCEAVDYAHSRGILHRDIKPHNIMLGKYGETLVVDWGIAKAFDQPDTCSDGEALLRPQADDGAELTRTGSVMGTLGYMSPEQADGRLDELGPASDVFSLGATLYCLLTGRPPFVGRDVSEILQKARLAEFPSPRELRREITPSLEAICLKAMAARPDGRYDSPRALADEVEHWLADEPVTAYREGWGQRLRRWSRRHRAWAQASAAAIVLTTVVSVLAAVAIVESRHSEAEAQNNENEARKSMMERLSFMSQEKNKVKKERAEFDLRRALDLLELGRVTEGILHLARALEQALGEEKALRRVILTNLWSRTGPLRPAGGNPGHQVGIHAVAFSPDGRKILARDGDRTLRLRDAITGQPIGLPLAPSVEADVAAFSPDGKLLGTGGPAKTACLWDVASGRPIGTPLDHPGRVAAMAFSPDSRILATGADDGTARLWDVSNGRPFGPPLAHAGGVIAVAFDPTGKMLLTRGHGEARLWDVATGRPIGTPLDRQFTVGEVAFSPDGKRVLTRDEGGMARLWEANTGRPIGPPLSHPFGVTSAAFSPDGKYIVTSSGGDHQGWNAFTSSGGDHQFWDASTGRPGSFEGAPVFGSDGRLIGSIVQSKDGKTSRFRDLVTKRMVGPDLANKSSLTKIDITKNCNILAIGGLDKTAQLWDVATGQPIGPPLVHQDSVRRVEFRPDGKVLITEDNLATRLWDTSTGRPIGPPLKRGQNDVTFSPDGKTVAGVSRDDGTVRLWDIASGEPIGPPLARGLRIAALVFRSDGKGVVAGLSDQAVRLWDLASGRPLGPPLAHRSNVGSVTFLPDGKTVLTVSGGALTRSQVRPGDAIVGSRISMKKASPRGEWAPSTDYLVQEVRLWDVATGRPVGVPLAHRFPIELVVPLPDGKSLLTVCRGEIKESEISPADNVIGSMVKPTKISFDLSENYKNITYLIVQEARLWDAASGLPLGPPLADKNRINAVTFSPDGKILITTHSTKRSGQYVAENSIPGGLKRLWDCKGRPIATPHPSSNSIFALAFSPDRRIAVTGSDDGTARLWEVDTGKPIVSPLVHHHDVDAVAFGPDGRALVTRGPAGRMRLWNAPFVKPTEGQQLDLPDEVDYINLNDFGIQPTEGQSFASPRLAAFSPDGTVFVTSDRPSGRRISDGTSLARLWMTATGRPLKPSETPAHGFLVPSVVRSPESMKTPTGVPLKPGEFPSSLVRPIVLEHRGRIESVAFRPDGKAVITGSADNSARLWDVATGDPIGPPLMHRAKVVFVDFSTDGKTVVTGSSDGAARLWDAETGLPLGPPLSRAAWIPDAPFSPDDKIVIVADLDGWSGRFRRLRPWEGPGAIDADARSVTDWVRRRTRLELDAGGGIRPVVIVEYPGRNLPIPPTIPTVVLPSIVWANEDVDGQFFARRGLLLAGLGRWERAIPDFTKAIEAAPDDFESRTHRLRCQLQVGDLASYRKDCRELLDRSERIESSAQEANTIAWCCSLIPDAVADHERPVRMAERAVFINNQYMHVNTLGATLYRAGHYEEAGHRLEEAIRIHGKGGTPVDWLFLAMARQKQGQVEEARRWLEMSILWFEQAEAGKLRDRFIATPLTVYQRLELQALRSEAESLMSLPRP